MPCMLPACTHPHALSNSGWSRPQMHCVPVLQPMCLPMLVPMRQPACVPASTRMLAWRPPTHTASTSGLNRPPTLFACLSSPTENSPPQPSTSLPPCGGDIFSAPQRPPPEPALRSSPAPPPPSESSSSPPLPMSSPAKIRYASFAGSPLRATSRASMRELAPIAPDAVRSGICWLL
eukprot:356454-Chlamydomonas_euryale.AAC.3